MSTICSYEVHHAAELFPMMSTAEFDGLVKDIEQNGQQDPIVVDIAGRLIDGRNRARACEHLELQPTAKVYDGDDVLQYVISHNLHRRHLTDSQRAMIAAKLATRTHGQHGPGKGEFSRTRELPPSAADAAAMMGVSEATIFNAKLVVRDGVDELQDLVAQGSVPILTATRVASALDPDGQRDYVDKVKAGSDPVKVAPAPKGRLNGRPPSPPRHGPRRKHVQILDALIVQLSGATSALAEIAELDHSVTAEEAARIRGDLSTSLRSVNRIIHLLKERTP